LAHVLEYDAVVGGFESAFEFRVHYVDIIVVYLCVLHHHHDAGEGVVDAAKESEPVLQLAKDAVCYCILGA
jgi:hypothetical protein